MFEVIVFILILSFLVFVHELGHFLAAKKSGVIVEEFGIGYPPRAIKLFTWRGTDFTLNYIPFGGFVRLAGEQAEYEEVRTKEEIQKFKKSEQGRFYAATTAQKLLILLAGAAFNLIFGLLAFTLIYSHLGIPEPITTPRVGGVMPETPAAEAGMREGVEILQIVADEVTHLVNTPDQVVEIVSENLGKTVTVMTTGDCEGRQCTESLESYQIYLRTEAETPDGQGSMGIIFQPAVFVQHPWWQMPFKSAWYGLQQTLFLSEQILIALGSMMSDLILGGEVPRDVAGPIGIVHQASTAGIFADGFITILSFAAMLSINLAIMNVLPIPPLDGGRAVFIIFQGLVSEKYAKPLEYYLNYGGYFLLLLLILLITARDIWRILG